MPYKWESGIYSLLYYWYFETWFLTGVPIKSQWSYFIGMIIFHFRQSKSWFMCLFENHSNMITTVDHQPTIFCLHMQDRLVRYWWVTSHFLPCFDDNKIPHHVEAVSVRLESTGSAIWWPYHKIPLIVQANNGDLMPRLCLQSYNTASVGQ